MSWEAGESWEQAGVSWSELERARRLKRAGSKLGVRWSKGMSWSELGASWSELGGWRELRASWSKGSKLE